MSDLTVTVKLRWEGEYLKSPIGNVGHVGRGVSGWYWSMLNSFGGEYGGPLPTQNKARAAVEAAAIKALGGHADE